MLCGSSIETMILSVSISQSSTSKVSIIALCRCGYSETNILFVGNVDWYEKLSSFELSEEFSNFTLLWSFIKEISLTRSFVTLR